MMPSGHRSYLIPQRYQRLNGQRPHAARIRGADAYRPQFLSTDQKPAHDAVRTWVRGFWKAMELAPDTWSALVEDERTKTIIAPFVGSSTSARSSLSMA